MTRDARRRALQLLPTCATTGIGSLPHTQLELAIQMAFQVDIPFLPQLPAGNPNELMIATALDGLPGLSVDAEGMCTVDLEEWAKGRDALEGRLEVALKGDNLGRFEPSPQACRAFRPFLWEIEHRQLRLAKAQLAGPLTVRWVARTSKGGPLSSVPDLDRQVLQLVLAKAMALAQALRKAGATPLIFLDEPGLYAFDRTDPLHLLSLQELKMVATALQREGAWVGMHCCSNTAWPLMMDLGLDFLSVDTRLSLDALLEDAAAFTRFLASGGTLSLGVIPTDVASTYEVEVMVDSIEASLRSTLPKGISFPEVVSQMLLTPACGLAMRSVVDAERIFEQVRSAQRLLRRRIET
jgi:methionine synthase II (cobalamin-independent)